MDWWPIPVGKHQPSSRPQVPWANLGGQMDRPSHPTSGCSILPWYSLVNSCKLMMAIGNRKWEYTGNGAHSPNYTISKYIKIVHVFVGISIISSMNGSRSHYTAEIFRTAISVWSKRQLWVACEPSSLDFFFFLSSPSCSAGCKMLRANFSWKTTSQRNTSLWVHQGTKAEKLCMLSWSWQASGAEPAHESPKEWMQSRVSIEWIQNLPRWIEWINSK